MLIPEGFQCLVVVQRNALGEVGCIQSLRVAPWEFGCAQWLLNPEVFTWLHQVTSLSPRTGVYVLCTLLFGCLECSGCNRVQSIYFTDDLTCHIGCQPHHPAANPPQAPLAQSASTTSARPPTSTPAENPSRWPHDQPSLPDNIDPSVHCHYYDSKLGRCLATPNNTLRPSPTLLRWNNFRAGKYDLSKFIPATQHLDYKSKHLPTYV